MARSERGAHARRAIRTVPRRAAFLVTMTCLALAAGCGLLPAAPGTLDAAGQSCGSAITFAIGSSDIDWLPQIISEWNARHPSERVEPLYLPQASNGQLAMLAGSLQEHSCLYDVIDMDVVWTAMFASKGWIRPLTFNTSRFLKPAVSTAMYDGQLYAVPDYANTDLLYYRKDLMKTPPRTWPQLISDAERLSRADHLEGYDATLAAYEGLTVNFTEAPSPGNPFKSADGEATVNSWQALDALDFLVNGIKAGWISPNDLGYEESGAQKAFLSGGAVFLNIWPNVYTAATTPPSPGNTSNKVYGKVGVTTLPGPSAYGGANLAVSSYSQNPAGALAFIKFVTDQQSEQYMFIQGGLPPVLTGLYDNLGWLASHPGYRPLMLVLRKAIDGARLRPVVTSYEQASQVIFGQVEQALQMGEPPQQAITAMTSQLAQLQLTSGG